MTETRTIYTHVCMIYICVCIYTMYAHSIYILRYVYIYISLFLVTDREGLILSGRWICFVFPLFFFFSFFSCRSRGTHTDVANGDGKNSAGTRFFFNIFFL